jgi:hypothetical protein
MSELTLIIGSIGGRRGCCIPADTVETDLQALRVERQMFATSSRSGVRLVAPPILKQLQPAVDVPPSDDTTVDQGQKKAVEVERRRGGGGEEKGSSGGEEEGRKEMAGQGRRRIAEASVPLALSLSLSLSLSLLHSFHR